MDKELLNLLKISDAYEYKEEKETAYLFYLDKLSSNSDKSIDPTVHEINYYVAERMQKGDLYKTPFMGTLKVIGKQYDDLDNIILLSKLIDLD